MLGKSKGELVGYTSSITGIGMAVLLLVLQTSCGNDGCVRGIDYLLGSSVGNAQTVFMWSMVLLALSLTVACGTWLRSTAVLIVASTILLVISVIGIFSPIGLFYWLPTLFAIGATGLVRGQRQPALSETQIEQLETAGRAAGYLAAGVGVVMAANVLQFDIICEAERCTQNLEFLFVAEGNHELATQLWATVLFGVSAAFAIGTYTSRPWLMGAAATVAGIVTVFGISTIGTFSLPVAVVGLLAVLLVYGRTSAPKPA